MMKVKLIYKAEETYLKTSFPAYYFGASDDRVYVIYKSHYLTPSGKSGYEFVVARHEQFTYNYLEEKLIENLSHKPPFLNSLVDRPNIILTNVKTSKSCKSYADAEELLNIWIKAQSGKADPIRKV